MNNEDITSTESTQPGSPDPASGSSTPLDSQPPLPRRSSGKIASLPLTARNLINQALRDGLPYVQTTNQLTVPCYPTCAWYLRALLRILLLYIATRAMRLALRSEKAAYSIKFH